MQTSIFDLDGTVINSKHRYTALENGGIDLNAWIRDNTRENCFKDTLLPTVRTLRADYKAGCNVVICTARVLSEWDYEFFMENNIPFHTMLDRPMGCDLSDVVMKEFQLRNYAHQGGISWNTFCESSMFFEDVSSILDRMDEIGMPTIDARLWNYKLSMVA